MKINFWQTLCFKMGLSIVLGSMVLTAALSLVIYHYSIGFAVKDSNHRISELVNTVKVNSSMSAYLTNKKLVEDTILGLTRNDIVSGSILYSESGMRINGGTNFHLKDIGVQRFNLYSPFFRKNKIGEIFIKPNHKMINIQARKFAQLHVLILVFNSIIITLFSIIFVNIRVARPLIDFSALLYQIEPGGGVRLQCPSQHKNDEIGMLVGNTNHLLETSQNTMEGERRLRKYVETVEKETRKEADRDPLTNLLNRRAGIKAIIDTLRKAEVNNTSCAILLVDLDRFKSINDNYGHDAGDKTLVAISNILTRSLRKSDIVIRWGGDEFLILIQQGRGDLRVNAVAEKIMTELESDILIGENVQEKVGASIGISIFPDHAKEPNILFDLADRAMYNIKRSGRNGYFIHSNHELAY